jgi:hypothetical protein
LTIVDNTKNITKEWLLNNLKTFKYYRELGRIGGVSHDFIKSKIIEFELMDFYLSLKNKYKNKKCFCGSNKDMTNFNNEWYCGKHYMHMKRHGKILKRTRFDKNEIIEYPDKNIAEIILYDVNQEEICRTIIDIEDVDILKKYKWYLKDKNNSEKPQYARTNIRIKGKPRSIDLHRILMKAYGHNIKNKLIDHIDRNTLDNKKCNLRIVTHEENSINKGIQKNNTSGVTGVTFNSTSGKWEAQIKLKYKNNHLGAFDKFEDAVEARLSAEDEFFGKYNPIDRYSK